MHAVLHNVNQCCTLLVINGDTVCAGYAVCVTTFPGSLRYIRDYNKYIQVCRRNVVNDTVCT